MELLYSSRAAKDIKRLEPAVKNRVRSALESLVEDPRKGKPLVADLRGIWSLRVGKCRVLYKFQSDEIEIITVRFRRESYR